MVYGQLALERAIRAFFRTRRAYFARLDLLGPEHDEQMYWLARACAHEARRLR